MLAVVIVTAGAAMADSAQPPASPAPAPTATPLAAIPGSEGVDPTTPTRDWTLLTVYTGSSYAPGDLRLWQYIPREEVLRVGKSLLRATLPSWTSVVGGPSGWGDSQAFYLFATHTAHGGYGPGVSMWFPTAGSPKLGTGKWSVGPSFGYVNADVRSKLFVGFLTQSFFSFAGPSWRKNQSLILFQPLFVKGLGKGWSIRSVDANWTFDLERGSTVLPLSLGVGKQVYFGSQKVNLALADIVAIVRANAPAVPKNSLKFTISFVINK